MLEFDPNLNSIMAQSDAFEILTITFVGVLLFELDQGTDKSKSQPKR